MVIGAVAGEVADRRRDTRALVFGQQVREVQRVGDGKARAAAIGIAAGFGIGDIHPEVPQAPEAERAWPAHAAEVEFSLSCRSVALHIASIRSPRMISAEQNELMTRVGPGSPCGKLLRRYWQPVALVDEMTGPRPVKPVRVLGENLVLFKEKNRYGLIERQCAHR